MLNPSVQYQNVVRDSDGCEVYNEAETMWDIAVRVKAALDRDRRVEAYLSRQGRRHQTTLKEECELARKLRCDAFVSLHSDAAPDDSPGGGTWTFYRDEEGKRLAVAVHSRLVEAIASVYPEVVDRGVREHWNRLYVLWNAGCPASLTEILFHSNPTEREMLKQPEFQDLVALAVAQAMLDYFGLA